MGLLNIFKKIEESKPADDSDVLNHELAEIDRALAMIPKIELTHPVFSFRNYELYLRHGEIDLAKWQLRGMGDLVEDLGNRLPEEFWQIVQSSKIPIVETAYQS